MSDPNSKRIIVGAIAGAHGVRGDVRVRSFTENPETLFELGDLLGESGETVLTPKSYRWAKDLFIVTPNIPRAKEEWDKLKGTQLSVPRGLLPEPEEDAFYVDDLVGMAALTSTGQDLGRVHAVLNHGAGDLIELRGGASGSGVMIPMTLEDVPDIDVVARRIIIGNFELWAGDTENDQPESAEETPD
ncbi:MAG: ribosome maturation factor RimM [Pseudomonadota bacterium]